MEAERAAGTGGRLEELAEGREDALELDVVAGDASLEGGELAGKFLVATREFAQAHEPACRGGVRLQPSSRAKSRIAAAVPSRVGSLVE